jgi:WD40 repeat protein
MIIVWDLATGSIMRRIWLEAFNTYPSSIKLESNSLFVCGLDGRVRIVNMMSGRVVQTTCNFFLDFL